MRSQSVPIVVLTLLEYQSLYPIILSQHSSSNISTSPPQANVLRIPDPLAIALLSYTWINMDSDDKIQKPLPQIHKLSSLPISGSIWTLMRSQSLTWLDFLSLYPLIPFPNHIADSWISATHIPDHAGNKPSAGPSHGSLGIASTSHIKTAPCKFQPSDFDMLLIHLYNLNLTDVPQD